MLAKIITVLALFLVQGCAQISDLQSQVPSFWDDNQSAKITDIRVAVEEFRCEEPQLPQLQRLRSQILWFDLYSEGKGPRQDDVRRALRPLRDTVEEFYQRTQKSPGSLNYCQIKVKILQQQAQRVSRAVLGRF